MTPSSNLRQERHLKTELRIFGEQTIRLVDAILNRLFDLKASSAYYRLAWFIVLLILAGFVVSLAPYPWMEWRNHLQQFLLSLFVSADKFAKIDRTFALIRLGIQAYFNPYVLWYAPAFFLPIFIAYQAASFYLADIFDLSRIGIARKFIRQVTLTGGRNVIHISEGDITPEDRDSPIARIGGPGKVVVSLDSVALFEKADGRPNIIGPTDKERKGKATLDGFERFRQAFDLRDQYIDLRDDNGKKSAVKSRSLDGIPVAATDVRLMFSVHRAGQKPTPEMPYPYRREAIEQQVYKATSKVTPHLTTPSQLDFVFENSILSLVRRELGGFMSQNKLTEYLASISDREVKKANDQEKIVSEEARLVLAPFESVGDAKEDKHPTPTFIPRREITDLFSQFAKRFTEDAQDRGIELHWIGIGTWDVPIDLVPEKHLEAWKMSQENTRLNQEMDKVKDAAKAQKILTMIQSIPLDMYHGSIAHNQKQDEIINVFIQEYYRQLTDNFEFQHTNKKRIPPTIAAAIIYLAEIIIFPPHHAPVSKPPAVSQHEEDLYNQLMGKIGVETVFAYRVIEKLISLEREFNAGASREQVLEKVNSDWDLDIAGKWRA